MPCPLERKINRLLREETKRWQDYPGFIQMSFEISRSDFCDISEHEGSRRFPNCVSSYIYGSRSARRRIRLQNMAIKTGFRHPNKPMKFKNPLIYCEFKTYGELYEALCEW